MSHTPSPAAAAAVAKFFVMAFVAATVLALSGAGPGALGGVLLAAAVVGRLRRDLYRGPG